MNSKQPVLVIWWPKAADQTRAEEEGRIISVRYEVQSPLGDKLHGGLETLNRLPRDLPCLVLVNPAELSLFAVVPPKMSGKKLKEALPFLVEPYLLNEPEDNHVSLWPCLPRHPEGAKLAAVLEKTRARQIVGLCAQQGLRLAALSCETLRENNGESGAAWLSDDDLLLVDGVDTPLLAPTTQTTVLKVMLQRRLHSAQTPVIELNAVDFALLTTQPGLEEALGEGKLRETARAPLEPLVRLLDKNLLVADELRKLGIRPATNQAGIRKLLAPALALVLVAVVGLNALAFKASQAQAALETRIAETFAQALPGTPMVADPLLLMEREKRNLNAGLDMQDAQGISALLHEAGLALDNAPFNSLQGFDWIDNTLSVRFNATVTPELQAAAVQKLKARRLEAKWTSGKETGQPVLQIKKGAAR